MYEWGIPIERIQKKYPRALSISGALHHGEGQLSNFAGDCGALILTGCNYLSKTDLEALMKIASMTGHSKIFGTIVTAMKETAKDQKKLFVDCGWRVIHEGKSNRTPCKDDIVVFYHNPDCLKSGY